MVLSRFLIAIVAITSVQLSASPRTKVKVVTPVKKLADCPPIKKSRREFLRKARKGKQSIEVSQKASRIQAFQFNQELFDKHRSDIRFHDFIANHKEILTTLCQDIKESGLIKSLGDNDKVCHRLYSGLHLNDDSYYQSLPQECKDYIFAALFTHIREETMPLFPAQLKRTSVISVQRM